MTRGWEHAADPEGVRVTGRGGSLAEAFAEAALGVFALMVPPTAVDEQEMREVRAHGESPEAFLASWIGECLYVHEVEGFVARRVHFVTFQDRPGAGGEPLRLHAWLHGEELDRARHGPGAAPLPAGACAISVEATLAGVEASVCLKTA